MNQVIKSVFVTLVLMITLNATFGQKLIKLKIDPQNDTSLVLSDGGTTYLGNVFNRSVLWEIDDSRISEFYIEGKRVVKDPWTDRPGSQFGTTLELKVRLFGPTGIWEYNILWKDRATGRTYYFDPIIAVKPGVSILEILLIIVFMITTITTIIFYRKWRKAEAKHA